jgi:hypothetical protein
MRMDHADALERIEIAAAEPQGLERLMAGDAPDAAAVAGHLAGCSSCADELARIRQVAAIARAAIVAQPDPALRERTLAFVRAVGRDRSVEDQAGRPAGRESQVPVAGPPAARAPWRSRRATLSWAAAVAAAVLVGLAGFAAGGALRNDAGAGQDAALALLRTTTSATVRIEAQPDVQRVTLASTSNAAGAAGTLLFSPASGELVVVATGLAHEGAGQEYGCWVEVNGERRRLGKMYWGGDVAAWAGSASGLAALPPGSAFGVSLGPVGGGDGAVPMLTGRL